MQHTQYKIKKQQKLSTKITISAILESQKEWLKHTLHKSSVPATLNYQTTRFNNIYMRSARQKYVQLQYRLTPQQTENTGVWWCQYWQNQDLQHHWLTPDRFLKRISDTICTTTARTCQQDCHYCSLLQLWGATTIIILSTHLKVTFMANISVSLCELYNSQPALCSQISTVCAYKYYDNKTLCQLLTL